MCTKGQIFRYNGRLNCLFGTGLGTYGYWARPLGSRLDTPDNMYLLMLAERGMAGLVSAGGVLSLVLLLVTRENGAVLSYRRMAVTDRAVKEGFQGSFIAFSVNLLTWDALAFPVTRIVFWVLCGLAIAYFRGLPSGEGENAT